MDHPNLTVAKEVASRENWDYRLPNYDREAEDENPQDPSLDTGTSGLDSLHLNEDPWPGLGDNQTDDLSGDFEGDISTDGGDSIQRQNI